MSSSEIMVCSLSNNVGPKITLSDASTESFIMEKTIESRFFNPIGEAVVSSMASMITVMSKGLFYGVRTFNYYLGSDIITRRLVSILLLGAIATLSAVEILKRVGIEVFFTVILGFNSAYRSGVRSLSMKSEGLTAINF